MTRLLVVGTGGLAREFTSHFAGQVEIGGYSSRNPAEHATFRLPGAVHTNDVTPEIAGTDQVVVAIGAPAVRAMLFERFRRAGFSFPVVVHRTSVVSDRACLEEGVVISPQCVVSPGATVGALAYVNFSCGVGHDAAIGRFVQMNPGSQVGGAARIGDGALIGSGATVLQGIRIGAFAVVGSGSVVFHEVEERATVVGNPAKRLRALERPPLVTGLPGIGVSPVARRGREAVRR